METNVAELEARLAALAERARKARMRKNEREYPQLEDVQPVLAALVAAYRSAADTERERMRSSWRRSVDVQTWLYWIAGEWARGLAERCGGEDLENALAALSLEGGALSIEDAVEVLGVAWHRARRAGLDPRPAFEHAAVLSGADALAELLRGFERSEFFAGEVAPHLDAPELAYEAAE